MRKLEGEIEIDKNFLVPKHEIATEEEKQELIKKYGPLKYFPRILSSDPIVKKIGAKPGDLIKIYRKSPILKGKYSIYYRVVVERHE